MPPVVWGSPTELLSHLESHDAAATIQWRSAAWQQTHMQIFSPASMPVLQLGRCVARPAGVGVDLKHRLSAQFSLEVSDSRDCAGMRKLETSIVHELCNRDPASSAVHEPMRREVLEAVCTWPSAVVRSVLMPFLYEQLLTRCEKRQQRAEQQWDVEEARYAETLRVLLSRQCALSTWPGALIEHALVPYVDRLPRRVNLSDQMLILRIMDMTPQANRRAKLPTSRFTKALLGLSRIVHTPGNDVVRFVWHLMAAEADVENTPSVYSALFAADSD
jgi:hypothetical protein